MRDVLCSDTFFELTESMWCSKMRGCHLRQSGNWQPDILALKHESRKFRYYRDVEKSSRSFSSQSCQAVASRSPNRLEQKTSILNFRTTQKYLIFLLSCFRTRMSARHAACRLFEFENDRGMNTRGFLSQLFAKRLFSAASSVVKTRLLRLRNFHVAI